MLANDQMKPNRYGKWAQARSLYKKIQDTFAASGIVTVATYTQAKHYDKRHAEMFRCGKTGVYVQRGKQWDDISMSGFRFTIYN
jgi:hypothetical protein